MHPKLRFTLRCGHEQDSRAQPGSVITCRTCGIWTKISRGMLYDAQAAAANRDAAQDPPAPEEVPVAVQETVQDSTETTPPAAPAAEDQDGGQDGGQDNGIRLADIDYATGPLAEPLRAMIRLLLSAACARHHLAAQRPSGWLSGIMAGPTTRTGKTLTGLVIAKALGLDLISAVHLTSTESEKSLWGRRVQQGAAQYVIRPADVLGWPFTVIDEFDKATPDVRKATMRLLQGVAKVTGEPGQVIDIACTALVTANSSPEIVPMEYRRRSAVIDMTRAGVIDPVTASAVLDAVPVLPWRILKPPAAAVPPELLARMNDYLKARLTAAGYALTDVLALEAVALGRAAASQEPIAVAARGTVEDYLLCCATTGDLAPDEDDGDDDEEYEDDGDDGDGFDEEAAEQARIETEARIYRQRTGAIGAAERLRAELKYVLFEARAVILQPGVPQDHVFEFQAIVRQARGVVDDLDAIEDVPPVQAPGRVRIAGPDAARLIDHCKQLTAKSRPYYAAVAEREATDYAGWLQDRAGHSPVPSITDAPERPALTASGDPGGGMQLAVFRQARQALSQHSTPAAADTTVAEQVAAETARREKAGLPPLTGTELASYYMREPPRILPLMLQRRAAG